MNPYLLAIDEAERIIVRLTADRVVWRELAKAAIARTADAEQQLKRLREEMRERTQGWEPQR